MNGGFNLDAEGSEFVEVDPTGRYGRYNEILGKGASKIVYRAFDEYEGIEVAWNQVKLYDFLQSPEDLERLYCEIHLLKTLKHKNIMKLYASWVDTANRNINFVTEMFTSGTLRQYRLKHRRVNIRAVKHWCRQILSGLLYLHSHDPPVIHRDLKCDNIFINGNQGEVKIGDLGLAAILRKSHAAQCVGTPEFMAPEVYKEEYNELVDIYSFGMCVLEMITLEYPYSECTHHAQIYHKVISGKKPDGLYKVKNPEVRQFIEKCLVGVSSRLSARELLNDPFLQIDNHDNCARITDCGAEFDDLGPLLKQPLLEQSTSDSSCINGYSSGVDLESYNEWGYQPVDMEATGIELFEHHEDDHPSDVDITIKGKKREDGSIFLRLRMTDQEAHVRNIYFPFDIEMDTALSVATEMVAELDITDQDVTNIADMIDGEITNLVPEWKAGPGIEEETRHFSNIQLCQNCASTHTSISSFIEFLSNNPDACNVPIIQCANGCAAAAAVHGRFEEITYLVDGTDKLASNQPTEEEQAELWGQFESVEYSSLGSGMNHSDEDHENSDHAKGENYVENENPNTNDSRCSAKEMNSHSFSVFPSLQKAFSDDYENNVQWDQRLLQTPHHLESRELREKQLDILLNSSDPHSCNGDQADGWLSQLLGLNLLKVDNDKGEQKIVSSSDIKDFLRSCPVSRTQRARNSEAMGDDVYYRIQNLKTAKNLCTGSELSSTIHRTTSLPVDVGSYIV